jgi:hypothetical protein
MADTSPSLDLLCELSAHERRLAENPDAHGYLKLASGYAEAGWIKEATRAAQRAKALAQGSEGERTDGAVLSGPCTPKVLLEIVRSMTLTGKSGHLQLDAPGGIRVSLALADGQLVGAQSSDTAPAKRRCFGPPRCEPVAMRLCPDRWRWTCPRSTRRRMSCWR